MSYVIGQWEPIPKNTVGGESEFSHFLPLNYLENGLYAYNDSLDLLGEKINGLALQMPSGYTWSQECPENTQ
jgi:hypothetical protein